jgi:hypothetical protein
MGAIYKPFGILLGLLSGVAGRRLFDFVWTKIDHREPPEATTEVASWRRVLAVAAIEGMIFRITRVTVVRCGAIGWRHLTGVWPGEKFAGPDE